MVSEKPADIRFDHAKNNLNFVRLLLAILVILSHAPELVDGNRHREILTRLFHSLSFGDLAVDGFFVISGYLITKSWLSSKSAFEYLCKRVVRIYPGFIVSFFISVLIIGPVASGDFAGYYGQFRLNLLFPRSILLGVPVVPGAFRGVPFSEVNGSLWTVRYEFICYLVVLFLGLTDALRNRATSVTIFTVALLSYIYLRTHPIGSVLTRLGGHVFEGPRFIMFFFAGSCYRAFEDVAKKDARTTVVAGIVACLTLLNGVTTLVLFPLFFCFALMGFALMPIKYLSEVGRHADLSYGIYLYAWPIQTALIWKNPSINPWLEFVYALALSSIAGWVSWCVVERPSLDLGRSLLRNRLDTGGGVP